MLIKSIFMELRSRLRSCNVYITTTVDFRKNCNLKINIQANSIVLNYYPNDVGYSDNNNYKRRCDSLSSVDSLSDCFSDEEIDVTEIIPIDEFCRIIPNSMSGLKIEKNDISFRILTEPKNGGNFYKELVSPKGTTVNSNLSTCDLKVDITVGEDIKIVCTNCSNLISDDAIAFNRILELPSENLDVSDWFCHDHGNHSNSSPSEITIKPNKNDLFYRLCYFMINFAALSDKTNKFNVKRDIYHCNRCLAWLGVKSKDRSSVKLYNSTVKLGMEDKNVFKYSNDTYSLGNTASCDFVYTIERMTKEFNLGLQYALMCKILLECTISATKKHYLLIWVMDRELQVLKSVDDYILSDGEEKIKLISNFLTKILYKVESELNEEVEAWMTDPGVVTSEISKIMFSSGVEHLRNMSTKVPESFRSTNGFLVSYLKV